MCVTSADPIHPSNTAALKNQNLGGKDSHTTRAYQLVVNHRRQILATTIGLLTMCNYLADNVFSLYNERGVEENYKGAWILVDGGYPSWTSLICPSKESSSVRWL